MHVLREQSDRVLKAEVVPLPYDPGPIAGFVGDKIAFTDGVYDPDRNELNPSSPVTLESQGARAVEHTAFISEGRLFQVGRKALNDHPRVRQNAAWVGEPGTKRQEVVSPDVLEKSVRLMSDFRPEKDEVLLGTYTPGEPGKSNGKLRLSVWNALQAREVEVMCDGLEWTGYGGLNVRHGVYVCLHTVAQGAGPASAVGALRTHRFSDNTPSSEIVFGNIEIEDNVNVGKDFLAIWCRETWHMVVLDLREWPVKVSMRFTLNDLRTREPAVLIAGADLGEETLVFLDEKLRLLMVRRKDPYLDVSRISLDHEEPVDEAREVRFDDGEGRVTDGKGLLYDRKRQCLFVKTRSLLKIPIEQLS